MQSEQERHSIAHMKYLCDRATPESPEVCFDYTLCQNVLGQIERQAAKIAELKKADASMVGLLNERADTIARLNAEIVSLRAALTETDLSDCPSPADVKRALEQLRFTASHGWKRTVRIDTDVRGLLIRALDSYKLCPKCRRPHSVDEQSKDNR